MPVRIDEIDRKILHSLQVDASQSLDEIAKAVGSSKTPVWNRIRKLKSAGVIGQQTVILDAEALGFEACFFVLIRTSEHDNDWQGQFLATLLARDEVMFQGHPVVIVVGETPQAAWDGASAVDIDYEELDVVADIASALKQGAPLVWPNGIPRDESDVS